MTATGLALTLSDVSGEGRGAEGCENLGCGVARRMTRSAEDWRRGDLVRGMDLARQSAMGLHVACTGADCRTMAAIWYAFLLVFDRQCATADEVLDTALDEIGDRAAARVRAAAGMCRAELLFARDRMDAAVREAQSALGLLDALKLDALRPIGHVLMARRALRRGETAPALHYAERLTMGALLNHLRHMPARGAWVTAEVRDVRDGPESVEPIVRGLIGDEELSTELLAAEPESAAWLVRAARNLGDEALAALAVSRSSALAERNPSFRVLAAGAVHAAALFERDPQRLESVAARYAGRWSRASALEDAGTILAEGPDPGHSIELLRRSTDDYLDVGATRDAARVARKLRALGVRQGRMSRPGGDEDVTGRLTKTEFAVAELVSQGLTNARVGQEMFISTHTVAAHLKKIFRKLNVASRVELASQWGRLREDGGRPMAGPDPA